MRWIISILLTLTVAGLAVGLPVDLKNSALRNEPGPRQDSPTLSEIGRALSAIHGDPAKTWTVEGLAREAAMSRTVFSERMRASIGLSPMQYLTQWRMELACRLLADGHSNLAGVAPRVGYQSVGAFIRAFKKQFGVGPGRYQKTLAGQDTT